MVSLYTYVRLSWLKLYLQVAGTVELIEKGAYFIPVIPGGCYPWDSLVLLWSY